MWLQFATQPLPGQQEPHPTDPPEASINALRAWGMMGGINWTAVSTVCEYLGVDDAEQIIDQLLVIQDFYRR